MCLAIVSALADHPLPADVVSFGEVGLAGELRQVAHASRRLAEAARLGFTRAIVPANSANGVEGISLIRVSTVAEALAAVGLHAVGIEASISK
jgi:DNA repair protein RadA/Sms